LYGLDEVGILAGDVRFVVLEVDCPVTDRNAYGVQTCVFHIFEIVAGEESAVSNVSSVLMEGV
jgi:hypothetical protein